MQLDVNVDCSRVDIVDVSVGICSSTSCESDPAAGQLQPASLESSVDKSTPPMEAFRQKSAGTQRDTKVRGTNSFVKSCGKAIASKNQITPNKAEPMGC